MITRRSIRSYTDRQISEEDLNTILSAAINAPSGMNLQTWHFTAITNAEILNRINKSIKAAFTRSTDSRLQERGHNENYCCYYHAHTLIIVSNEPTQWWAPITALSFNHRISRTKPLPTS